MDKIREGNQNQLVSGTFKWRIENFSKMDKEKLYSQVFVVGGSKWYVCFCFQHFLFLFTCMHTQIFGVMFPRPLAKQRFLLAWEREWGFLGH